MGSGSSSVHIRRRFHHREEAHAPGHLHMRPRMRAQHLHAARPELAIETHFFAMFACDRRLSTARAVRKMSASSNDEEVPATVNAVSNCTVLERCRIAASGSHCTRCSASHASIPSAVSLSTICASEAPGIPTMHATPYSIASRHMRAKLAESLEGAEPSSRAVTLTRSA